jgi:hypothetical protein
MRKCVAVFTHDANEMVDSPSYRITRQEASERLERGYAVWLSPDSIRTKPPGWSADEEKLAAGGVYKEAWKPRHSDHYLVWQLVARDEDTEDQESPGR